MCLALVFGNKLLYFFKVSLERLVTHHRLALAMENLQKIKYFSYLIKYGTTK